MNKKVLLGIVLCTSTLQSGALHLPTSHAAESSASKPATNFGLLASKMGAALNTDLLAGGGSDDTFALQAILNRAEHGTPVHLVIDGAALVSGLNVYGNTTLECTAGGGLYLKDGSSRAIIRNAHRSRDGITDAHITVRGCFLNGNRKHQPGADGLQQDPTYSGPSNKEADGTYISGLQFLGVNDLVIENVTLWSIRAFASLIGNASRIDIRNVIVDHASAPDVSGEYSQTDGLHFKGPLRYLTIDGVKIRTGDDALAFSANEGETDDLTTLNEFGPYVGQGAITDVSVDHVQLMDTVQGIRIMSSTERVDRVVISNVTGTVRASYVATISHWLNPKSLGNFGSITFKNLNVQTVRYDPKDIAETKAYIEKLDKTEEKKNKIAAELNWGVPPFFAINAHVECLNLRNISTTVSDDRPILRIGPDAHIRTLTAEMSLYDPTLQAVPVKLDEGGHIEDLNLSIHWSGIYADQGKIPINSLGGTISRLHWIDTPPMYVNAALRDGRTIAVTFSQDVKGTDLKAGVWIEVGGKRVGIARALREPGRMNVVQYVLSRSPSTGEALTWAYDAAEGNIQNWSGDQLLSVSEKRATYSPLGERHFE